MYNLPPTQSTSEDRCRNELKKNKIPQHLLIAAELKQSQLVVMRGLRCGLMRLAKAQVAIDYERYRQEVRKNKIRIGIANMEVCRARKSCAFKPPFDRYRSWIGMPPMEGDSSARVGSQLYSDDPTNDFRIDGEVEETFQEKKRKLREQRRRARRHNSPCGGMQDTDTYLGRSTQIGFK